MEQNKSTILCFPPISELQKIIIGLTRNEKLNNQYHLGTVEITDIQLIKKYRFVCRKWIGFENYSDKIVQLEIPICRKPSRCIYELTTFIEELGRKKIMFSIVVYENEQNTKIHFLFLQ